MVRARAALVTDIGDPPKASEIDRPQPSAGQTAVAVTHATLNPVELRVAAGRMGAIQTPYVPGLEGVGTVVHSERFPSGSRVRFENHLPGFGKDGAIADMVAVDDDAIVELPDGVGDAAAAAVGVVGITAWLAIQRASLQPGEKVAVLGATGGVGHMAVQIARLRGASAVIAIGRDPAALQRVRTLGASATVSLRDLDPGHLADATGGNIDVVVDTLWGESAMEILAAMAPEGRLVNVGNVTGKDVSLPLQEMRKNRSAVIGLSSGWTPLSLKLEAYRAILEAMTTGDLTVDHEVIPLDSVDEAWRRQTEFPHRKLVISLG